jgi:hypothetical protein
MNRSQTRPEISEDGFETGSWAFRCRHPLFPLVRGVHREHLVPWIRSSYQKSICPAPKGARAGQIDFGRNRHLYPFEIVFVLAAHPRRGVPRFFSRVGFQFGCYCQQDLRSKSCLRGTSPLDQKFLPKVDLPGPKRGEGRPNRFWQEPTPLSIRNCFFLAAHPRRKILTDSPGQSYRERVAGCLRGLGTQNATAPTRPRVGAATCGSDFWSRGLGARARESGWCGSETLALRQGVLDRCVAGIPLKSLRNCA